ncbi:ECF transporter S component [Pectinatus frisingensis]|uniref:ECF transporter S component n=1 Tax=Pectinatus frisingensis TaxID=865 RepID=UPI0018C79258|nr:ECF transporter S component [Pectinatus frisingensis]
MKNNNMWSLKLNTAALVLIPAAVGINYIGKLFAGALKLPLWLDSIGTILAACMAGPIVGALCGAINNIIYGFTLDPVSFIYAVSQIGIGICAGVLAWNGAMKGIVKAIISGIIIAIVSALISTPINIALYGGQTGNLWGDALFAACIANNLPLWLASGLDELIVDIPDKIAVVLIVCGIYNTLPKKLIILYRNDQEIEKLD